MGARAGNNIYQHMLQARNNIEPTNIAYPEISPIIALAIGNKAVVYDAPKGTRCSEEQMTSFFGSDLGLRQFWDAQSLSEKPAQDLLR